MWKFIQNIPRSIRQHWNTSHWPGTVACHEDDDRKARFSISRQSPSVFARINRYQSGTNPNSNEKRHKKSDDEKWWNHPSFWYTNQLHSPLEAFGVGTAILFGLQCSQFWNDWYKETAGKKDTQGEQCILGNFLNRCAFAMPGQGQMIKYCQDKPTGDEPKPSRQGDSENLQSENKAISELVIASAAWEKLSNEYVSKAITGLGLQHAERGNPTEAIKMWKKASEIGFAGAHFNLGLAYETGHGVEQDFMKSAEHYHLAAGEGHTKALYNLAVLYLRGEEGVEKNTEVALNLLEKAAELGLKQAQTDLGVLYTEDERKDMTKASSLFQMAANQDDPDGKFYLGVCYEQGWGVPCNQCKSAQLYNEAAHAGHKGAQYNLAVFFEQGLGGLPQSYTSALELYKKCGDVASKEAINKLQIKQQEELDTEENLHFSSHISATRGQHTSAMIDIPMGMFHHSNSSPSLLNSPRESSSTPPSLLQRMKEHLLNSLSVWRREGASHDAWNLTPSGEQMEGPSQKSHNVWQLNLSGEQHQVMSHDSRSVVEFYIDSGDLITEASGHDDSAEDLTTRGLFKLNGNFGGYHLEQNACSMMQLQRNRNFVPCA